MKSNLKILTSLGFIIILIISSCNVNAKLPKSISDDIWVDGIFEGKILINDLDGNISGMINLGRSSTNLVKAARRRRRSTSAVPDSCGADARQPGDSVSGRLA